VATLIATNAIKNISLKTAVPDPEDDDDDEEEDDEDEDES
jgi:hypothetical protein